jgi:hypothetical protein
VIYPDGASRNCDGRIRARETQPLMSVITAPLVNQTTPLVNHTTPLVNQKEGNYCSLAAAASGATSAW